MNERLEKLMLEAGYAAPDLAGRAQKLVDLVVEDIAKEFYHKFTDEQYQVRIDKVIRKLYKDEE